MPTLKEFAITCGYLGSIGLVGVGIYSGLTDYLKVEPIPSVLFSLIALLIIAVAILNGEVKTIKEKLSTFELKKKKGAIDIVTAIIIVVILLLLIYLSLQGKMGG